MRQLQDIVTYAADEGSPHVVLELDNDLKRKFDGMRVSGAIIAVL